jgi:biopolymer transport protein ExbD
MRAKTIAKTAAVSLGFAVLLWYGSSYVLNVWMIRSPYLWAAYDPDRAIVQYICLSVAGAALVLALRAGWKRLTERFIEKDGLRMVPDLKQKHVLPMKRFPATRLISETPNFGLTLGCFFMVLLFLHMSFYKLMIPRGLPVLLFAQPIARMQSPVTETLGVYVDAHDEYFVNGEHIERAKLREKLSEELGKRVVWTAYVEGDMSSTYRETVNAIDTIEGLGAKPIWITPKMRREWKEEGRE